MNKISINNKNKQESAIYANDASIAFIIGDLAIVFKNLDTGSNR